MNKKELKKTLKNMSRPSLDELCDNTGLTELEKKIVMLAYLKQLPNEIVAYYTNTSASSLGRKKKVILNKICDYIDFIKVKN